MFGKKQKQEEKKQEEKKRKEKKQKEKIMPPDGFGNTRILRP